jgi:poly(ADP-ribose) glycohydrolase ARH3
MDARGLLAGVAFGDTYGLWWEFRWPQPRERWSYDLSLLIGIELCGNRYCYSDDTEMTIILAEELLDDCSIDQDKFALRLAANARLGMDVRRYGTTTSSVLRMIRSGEDWREASKYMLGKLGSPGNGSSIRVAPIAAFYDNISDVIVAAKHQSIVTHMHPLSIEGSYLLAIAQHITLRGVKYKELIDELIPYAESRVYKYKLSIIPSLLDSRPIDVVRKLGNGAQAPNSVPTAIYCYIQSRGDPAKATLCAINIGGDTDSIASMATSLAGAASGIESFPQELLKRVENIEYIIELAERLIRIKNKCRQQ